MLTVSMLVDHGLAGRSTTPPPAVPALTGGGCMASLPKSAASHNQQARLIQLHVLQSAKALASWGCRGALGGRAAPCPALCRQ